MSSIFDNDNHDNLDRACLLHILNNIPSEHKHIYTQVWYDMLKAYLHNKNMDIRFKSYVINKFTEVAPTWTLSILSHYQSYYPNLFGQMILIKNVSRDNIQSILGNINSKLVCLEINPNEVSNIIKWYGTWEAYWNDVFNQICYSILDGTYSIQWLDKRDIINITDYTIYEDNIKAIKPTENIIDIYKTYSDYIYKLLELNNKGMPN